MSLLEELQSQFDALNVSVKGQVLQKCGELCDTYRIDPEDFVDQWLAYTASNLNGEPPTLDMLDRMERRELQKQFQSSVKTTPQAYRKNVAVTPIRTPARQKQNVEIPGTPQVLDRMEVVEDCVSYNVPSQSFANRTDSGSVIREYGEANSDTFKNRYVGTLTVKIQNEMTGKIKYMYEKFLLRVAAFDSMAKTVISSIIKRHDLELSRGTFKQFSDEMVICGRICSELHEKLDQGSILLEGLVDLYKGQRIKIKTNNMNKVRLFSGESVVVVGNNMRDFFSAKHIFTGIPVPPSPAPEDLKETLQIIVAAGPFTLQENLLYEPLNQLLKVVIESKPNLLILMGPFMEGTNPHFDSLPDSYDSFFENMIDGIMQRLKGTGVKVVLIPSHKEVHRHPVFPTFPYKLKKRHENLYLPPDPFIIDVNGLIIGGSTVDILFHFARHETSKGAFEDRVGHLIAQLFTQRNFYPLHPPDRDIGVDYQLLHKYGMIQNAPHIMILPSTFKHFIRSGVMDIADECTIVNPERLTKGNGGGTFAKMEIRGTPQTDNISHRISCVIQHI